MTLKYFSSKEEYIKYIKSWKIATNSDKTKSTIVTKKCEYSGEYYTFRQNGWLQSEHFLLHNILLNKNPETGFTLISNKNKLLLSRFYLNNGFYIAVEKLNRIIMIAKWINGEKNESCEARAKTYKSLLERFLEPYAGTITVDILSKIEPLKISPIYPDFGVGLKIVQKIIDEKIKFDNYQQLYHLLDELKS